MNSQHLYNRWLDQQALILISTHCLGTCVCIAVAALNFSRGGRKGVHGLLACRAASVFKACANICKQVPYVIACSLIIEALQIPLFVHSSFCMVLSTQCIHVEYFGFLGTSSIALFCYHGTAQGHSQGAFVEVTCIWNQAIQVQTISSAKEGGPAYDPQKASWRKGYRLGEDTLCTEEVRCRHLPQRSKALETQCATASCCRWQGHHPHPHWRWLLTQHGREDMPYVQQRCPGQIAASS